MGTRRDGPERSPKGQVLVIFAMSLVALMGIAGLAFDVGRFYSEKRFLQNAADAGALAVANALIRGESTTNAEAEGRDVLARNLLGSPSGTPALVAATPQYATGHPGEAAYLTSGVLISPSGDVRVAVKGDVGYTFGRVLGLGSAVVGGQARVATKGDLLPIVVRHFVNAPGPYAGATAPCDGNVNAFQDLIATANTACLGSEADGVLRSPPNPGSAFNPADPGDDPVNHGPIIALVGQGAQPSNSASFRGFVALDIRNFSSSNSNVFYNGVTPGMNANTLKKMQADWVATGYPGPAFPPVTSPPDPDDQIGIIDGNSSGIVVDAISGIRGRYKLGDEVLAAVYSGTVMTIPDFSIAVPNSVTIDTTQNRANQVSMSVTRNDAFAGTVDLSAFKDWGDVSNPYGGSLAPIAFTPSPVSPPATVTWSTFETTNAPVGVYTVWLKGHSPSPYLTDNFFPIAVTIGGVVRDFSSSGSGLVISTESVGQTGTGQMTFSTPNKDSTSFGGTVNLSIEGGPQSNGVLPIPEDAVSVSPASITLSKGSSQTVTLSVDGSTLGPGEYKLTVRATGTNSDMQVVTRQIPFSLAVGTASTNSQYVDIQGFAVFRITSADSNAINGYAISDVYPDMNDPALRRGQVARLVPWN